MSTSNKHYRSATFDDSSSTNSRASGSHSGKCRKCGEPESLPSKPIIKCPSCSKRRMHAHCHNPPVDLRSLPIGWKCKTCRDDIPGLDVAKSHAKEYSAAAQNAQSSAKMNAKICKESGCEKLTDQFTDLCKMHRMALQHKLAAAKRQASTAAPMPRPNKPFKKSNLYNFKPDEEEKVRKRKRMAPTTGGYLGQSPKTPLSRPTSASGLADITTMSRTPGEKARHIDRIGGNGISLGSASMAESPVTPRRLNAKTPSQGLASLAESPNTPALLSMERHASIPDFVQKPPTDIRPETFQVPTTLTTDQPSRSSLSLALQDQIHKTTVQEEEVVIGQVVEDLAVADQDEEMRDVSENIQQTLEQAYGLRCPGRSSTSTDSMPELYRPREPDDVEQKPDSIKAIRIKTTADYNPEELDYWLERQADREPNQSSNPQELASSQLWGHIDPRKAWSQATDENWLGKKRKEIDARGNKKSNYGKNLTSQVRKERADKGWHIHQNCEPLSDEVMSETARHMEELFGIKVDRFVPAIKDGQLVMLEKRTDVRGRKKAGVRYLPDL